MGTLVKNLFLVTGAVLFLRVSTAVTTILLTRMLPLAEFGAFAYGQTISLLLMFGVSIGLPNFLVQQLAAGKKTAAILLRASLILMLFLSVLGVILIAAAFTTGLLPSAMAAIAVPMALGGSALGGNMVLQGIFRAFDRYPIQAMLIVSQGLAMAGLILGLAFLGADAVRIAWGFCAVAVGLFAIHLLVSVRMAGWEGTDAVSPVTLLKGTLPFGLIDWIIAGIPFVLSTALILGAGIGEVAIFNVAMAVFSAVTIVLTLVDQIFLREIVREAGSRQNRIALFYLTAAAGAGLVAGTSLYFGADILALLFFQTQPPGLIPVFKLFSVIVFFRFIALACSSLDRMTGNHLTVLAFYVLGLASLVLLAYWNGVQRAAEAATVLLAVEGLLAGLFLFRRRHLLGMGRVQQAGIAENTR